MFPPQLSPFPGQELPGRIGCVGPKQAEKEAHLLPMTTETRLSSQTGIDRAKAVGWFQLRKRKNYFGELEKK